MGAQSGILICVTLRGTAVRNEAIRLIEKHGGDPLLVHRLQKRHKAEQIVFFHPRRYGKIISELKKLSKSTRRNINYCQIPLHKKRSPIRTSYVTPYAVDEFLQFVINNIAKHLIAYMLTA